MGTVENKLDSNGVFEYIKSNIAHEFRNSFATINASLHSLKKTLPRLVDGYIKARNKGLVSDEYADDYLQLLHKTLNNSLQEIKYSDDFLNRLILFINQDKLFITNKENIIIGELLRKLLNEANIQPFQLSLQNDFVIEYNLHNISCCMRAFLEEIYACNTEQQSNLIIELIPENKTLVFGINRLKTKSNIYNSISLFMRGYYKERYGLVAFLLNKMLKTQGGLITMSEEQDLIRFIIQF